MTDEFCGHQLRALFHVDGISLEITFLASTKMNEMRIKIASVGETVLRREARPLTLEEIASARIRELIEHMRETLSDAIKNYVRFTHGACCNLAPAGTASSRIRKH